MAEEIHPIYSSPSPSPFPSGEPRGPKPDGFDELVHAIDSSLTEPGSNEIHEIVLKKCISYLRANHFGRHWFCDPYMTPITTHLLILFSFPDQKILSEMKPHMEKSLATCYRCINQFSISKSILRENFAITKGISIANVNTFLQVIMEWEATIIQRAFKPLETELSQGSKITVSELSPEILHAIHQCLASPGLFRTMKAVLESFRTVMSYSIKKDLVVVQEREILQGIIYLLFEGAAEHKIWAENCIKSLRDSNHIYTKTTLIRPIVEEFSVHFYRIQDARFFNEYVSVKFWSALYQILDLIDNTAFIEILNSPKDLEAMSEFTNLRLYPIIRVFFNNIMSFPKDPFRILLKLLDKFLVRFKASFWDYTAPFTYLNILDNTVSNPEFDRLLYVLPDQITPEYDYSLDDITRWLFSFMESLSESQQQTASIKLTTALLKINKVNKLQNPASAVSTSRHKVIDRIAFETLLKSFQIGNQSNDFRNKTFSVNLLRRREVRAILEYNADSVVELAVSDMHSCIKLISESLEYDLALLAHNTSVLLQDIEPASYDTFPSLWQSLAKKPIYSHRPLITEILKVLRNTSCSIEFINKKTETNSNKKLVEARKQHNTNVSLIFNLLGKLLEKISLADPAALKVIFTSIDGSIAIWSCVFSPLISQAALDILYQVFDVGIGGRFEAIQQLLANHLQPTLAAVNENLKNLTLMEAFEPCPIALRLLMDVINGAFDPLTGVISTSARVEIIPEIHLLWSRCWSFLHMIYKKTIAWANFYHLEDLMEFTRDTLDLSHSLLNSFRVILLNEPSKEKIEPLFNNFMDCFKSVVVWLRLGDMSLLNSCVELVFKGFDLAKDVNLPIDKEFLEIFVKYGAKAKKFNNKLTENQRSQILSKAREFDEALVTRIVTEAQLQRNKIKTREVIDLSDDSTPEPAAYKYQTHVKQPRQQTLGRYGVVSSEPPVAPAPKDIKSSGLDAIRRDLMNNRAPQVKPTGPVIAPAAPRPAGFNSRRSQAAVVGRSLNGLKKKSAESDSSEDEGGAGEVDFGDLFVDKKKKSKIIEVDINGKPITAAVSRQNKIDQARKEEENMRMRLNVSLKPLYNTILRWNYNSTDAYPLGDKDMYQETKSRYIDVKDYVKTTEPLLMLESWQGIQSAKQTGQEEPFDLLVGSRTSVDGFFDVYASCRKNILADRKIGDSDLLVLGFVSPGEFNSPKAVAAYLKAKTSTTCLAKVREVKSANADFSDVTLRVYPSGSMMGNLTPQSVIVGMRVMQMVTIEREFSSLKGLQYYDLSESILSATPNNPIEINDADAASMLQLYDVNKSQAKAIMGSYNSEGFSLIQGPPGTGKTKTILGIVGYSLSQQMKENVIDIPSEKSKSVSPSGENKPKILICAPSNAAVDELVLRLRRGVKNSKGELMPLRVVRLGRSDAINAAVRDLTLEELVDKELQSKSMDTSRDQNLRDSHTSCVKERDSLREQMQKGDLTADEQTAIEAKLRDVNRKRNELAKQLDDERERVRIAYRTKDIERRNVQAKILSSAQVICSTLSGSAHDFLAKLSVKFDQVIIDEACQCVELSAIIPLRYGCKKCIMVGDPNQLPPTVLSQTAASLNYEQSLFVRMQKNNPKSVYLLDVQYRMHPEISVFPSSEFYNSRLKDGEETLTSNIRPWHESLPLTPYRFFDIASTHQRNELSRSLFNAGEAKVALELVEKLMRIFPENEFAGRVGIISPYKAQINTLKDVFSRKYGRGILSEIDFNTVDGFQGQEKEIIIMSCVRASETGNVGFLSDIRRMNVALTRAKTTLWILGNMESLKRNAVWKRLLENAQSRNCVSKAYPGFLNSVSAKRIEKRPSKDEFANGSELKRFKQPEPKTFANEPMAQDQIQNQPQRQPKQKIPSRPSSGILPMKPSASKSSSYQRNSAPIKSSVFNTNSIEPKKPISKKNITIANSSIPTGSGNIPGDPNLAAKSHTSTNSVTTNQEPYKPTSSGIIRPVQKKSTSSVFLPRKKPKKPI